MFCQYSVRLIFSLSINTPLLTTTVITRPNKLSSHKIFFLFHTASSQSGGGWILNQTRCFDCKNTYIIYCTFSFSSEFDFKTNKLGDHHYMSLSSLNGYEISWNLFPRHEVNILRKFLRLILEYENFKVSYFQGEKWKRLLMILYLEEKSYKFMSTCLFFARQTNPCIFVFKGWISIIIW